MTKITFSQLDGTSKSVDAEEGVNLMRVGVDSAVPGIEGECGGEMSCATCHVYVGEKWQGLLPAQSEDEMALLEFTESFREGESRLACQIRVAPELDGLDVTRALRARPETHALPILLVSARAHEDDVAAGLEAGATDYVVKPFRPDRLLDLVEALVSDAATG